MLGLPGYGIEATSSGLKDPEVAHVLLYKWDCPKHRALANLLGGTEHGKERDPRLASY